jgi:hypothetical protein|tara:strand:- start:630 stop:899 length:270 start_codon:yes stop_codon:yes gene_type:complete
MSIKIKNTNNTLLDARNPSWVDEANTEIEVECKFSHYESIGITENDGYLLFNASSADPEPHGVAIYNACIAGTYGAIAEWVAPEPEASE